MGIARIAAPTLLGMALLAAAAGSSLAGKPKGKAPAKSKPVPAAAKEDATKFFNTVCFACHGTTGEGDGPGAAALNPKPRKFSDGAWQKSITDADIEKTILEGGVSRGKSPLMPPNPMLKDKPDVIGGLREIVRSFAKAK